MPQCARCARTPRSFALPSSYSAYNSVCLISSAAGGDAEDEAAAREVCAEAEILRIAADSGEAPPPVYLTSTPKSFQAYFSKQLEQR